MEKNTEHNMNNGGFSTPPSYFNDLETQVQQRISASTKHWMLRYKYALSAVAACTIVLSVWLLQAETTLAIPQIQQVDYAAYVNDNIEDFNDDEVADACLANNSVASNDNEYEAYSNYLLDENVDENTLIDEL
jgi:hypothetical protein